MTMLQLNWTKSPTSNFPVDTKSIYITKDFLQNYAFFYFFHNWYLFLSFQVYLLSGGENWILIIKTRAQSLKVKDALHQNIKRFP